MMNRKSNFPISQYQDNSKYGGHSSYSSLVGTHSGDTSRNRVSYSNGNSYASKGWLSSIAGGRGDATIPSISKLHSSPYTAQRTSAHLYAPKSPAMSYSQSRAPGLGSRNYALGSETPSFGSGNPVLSSRNPSYSSRSPALGSGNASYSSSRGPALASRDSSFGSRNPCLGIRSKPLTLYPTECQINNGTERTDCRDSGNSCGFQNGALRNNRYDPVTSNGFGDDERDNWRDYVVTANGNRLNATCSLSERSNQAKNNYAWPGSDILNQYARTGESGGLPQHGYSSLHRNNYTISSCLPSLPITNQYASLLASTTDDPLLKRSVHNPPSSSSWHTEQIENQRRYQSNANASAHSSKSSVYPRGKDIDYESKYSLMSRFGSHTTKGNSSNGLTGSSGFNINHSSSSPQLTSSLSRESPRPHINQNCNRRALYNTPTHFSSSSSSPSTPFRTRFVHPRYNLFKYLNSSKFVPEGHMNTQASNKSRCLNTFFEMKSKYLHPGSDASNSSSSLESNNWDMNWNDVIPDQFSTTSFNNRMSSCFFSETNRLQNICNIIKSKSASQYAKIMSGLASK